MNWSKKWLLKCNPAKCKKMHVGHSLDTKYYMRYGTEQIALESVSEKKDLGVCMLHK